MTTTILKIINSTGRVDLFQVTRKRRNSKKFEAITPIYYNEDISYEKLVFDYRSSGTNQEAMLQTSRRLYDFSVASYSLSVEEFYDNYDYELQYGHYEEFDINTTEIKFTYDLGIRMIYNKEDGDVAKVLGSILKNKSTEYHYWLHFRQDAFELLDEILRAHYRKFVNPENVEVTKVCLY